MGKFSEIDLIIKESKKVKNKRFAVMLNDNAHYPIYYEILEYSGKHVLLYDSIFNQTKLALESEIWQLT